MWFVQLSGGLPWTPTFCRQLEDISILPQEWQAKALALRSVTLEKACVPLQKKPKNQETKTSTHARKASKHLSRTKAALASVSFQRPQRNLTCLNSQSQSFVRKTKVHAVKLQLIMYSTFYICCNLHLLMHRKTL